MSKIAIVFPGQGSQSIGMGKRLYEQFDEVKHLFRKADDVLERSLTNVCFEGPEDVLKQTENTQTAIFLVSAAYLSCFKDKESIVLTAGHSVGEIAAYYAAGVLSFEDAIQLVAKRGQLMAESFPPEQSAMAAILGLKAEDVESGLSESGISDVVLANYNSPIQVVISGKRESVEKAGAYLKNKGAKRVVPLNVGGAFHSPLMNTAADAFQTVCESVTFNQPNFPIVLNRTGQPETDPIKLKQNLPLQIKSSVRWVDCVTYLSNQVDTFVECGEGKVLTGLIKKIAPQSGVRTLCEEEFENVTA